MKRTELFDYLTIWCYAYRNSKGVYCWTSGDLTCFEWRDNSKTLRAINILKDLDEEYPIKDLDFLVERDNIAITYKGKIICG